LPATRLLALTSDLAVAFSPDGTVLSANPAFARAAGRDPIKHPLSLFIHPEDHARAKAGVRRLLDGEPGVELEVRAGARVTGWRWVLATLGADGDVLYAIGKDVTEYRRSERRLAHAEDVFRSMAAAAPNGVFAADARGSVSYVNERLADILGRDGEALLGHRWLAAVPPSERGVERTPPAELRIRRPDGAERWVRVRWTAVGDGPAGYVGSVEDVTEEKLLAENLAHQALHDALTGLPNRVLFVDRLTHALARTRRAGTDAVAVLFLDVDRFKVINDSLGHEAGDTVLVDVAARLARVLRPSDTVARFGGDEFTVLCDDVAGEDEARVIAQRIVDVFEDEPFVLGGRDVYLSTSVGLAVAHGELDHPEDLIRDADAAMYRAKERGRARFELFDAEMRAHAVARLEVETALHRALDHGELRVHLQPFVDIGRGEVDGYEALVRWEHPARGLLEPAEFIPLAEETGLIVPLGRYVLREACATAAGWSDACATVAVNLSARQLAQPDVVEVVAEALAESGLVPERLCLELTESAVLEAGAAETLHRLKALGVRLALDDFGTGWSSLAHLRAFPIDVLKLDRSFVSGLGTEPQDTAIAAAVIALGHALGVRCVAEGVETAAQLAVLEELGCDTGQGFLFAAPGPTAGSRVGVGAA
jgi:Amt family ammonium transporter